jgi:very-short-patch-repair endonuclease
MGNNSFFNYRSSLKNVARKNRNNMTKAESLVWNMILKREKMGFKFLRQKPIGNFILDFYCAKLSLAIEIDDCSHEFKYESDMYREDYLKTNGIKIIRYSNDQAEKQLEYVFNDIKDEIKARQKELNI